MSKLFANPRFFSTWSYGKNAAGTGKSRRDYECTDHEISDMLHDQYWSTLIVEIEARDEIHIVDAANQRAVLVVDWKDAANRKVGISLLERLTEKPIVNENGLALKYRGPRGGLWCVVDAESQVVDGGHRTRQDAQRALDILTAPKAA